MTKISPKKTLNFMDLYTRFIKDSISGKRLQINGKKITAGTITSYNALTGATLTTITANASMTLQSDGTNWYRIQ